MDDDQDVSGLVQLARTPLPERHALLTSALSLPTLDPLAAVSTLRREYPDLDPGLLLLQAPKNSGMSTGKKPD